MSDPIDFSDYPDLNASFQAASKAITTLCHFEIDLNNLTGQFDLSAKAKLAAAEHDTPEICELGRLLVRQAPHVVAGFLAQHQLIFADCAVAVETHVKPLMNEFASARAKGGHEFHLGSRRYLSAAEAICSILSVLHLRIGAGAKAISRLMTAHVPEWREVLGKSGCHIRPFVESYYHVKAIQPASDAGPGGPAKTVSELWDRVRAAPGFQQAFGQHTLEVRIQNMFLLKHELLDELGLSSLDGLNSVPIMAGIRFEHRNVATERRKGPPGVPTPQSTKVAETVPYLFRFEGAVYRVRFKDESGTIDAALLGAGYIFEVLQHPQVFYSATTLRRSVEAADSGKTDQSELQEALRKLNDRLAELQDLDSQAPDFTLLLHKS